MDGGIGIIALARIVVNNAIVLLDYTRQLRDRGYDLEEAITTARMVCLRSVLMTAAATML